MHSGSVQVGSRPVTRPESELNERLLGDLIQPHDHNYDSAREIWNAGYQHSPALIARCKDEFDVIAAVQYAREHGLPLAVRGGGHSLPGHSSVEGGLVIDLTAMRSLRIDPVRRVARVQPGVTWGEYAQAAHAHGLATSSGDVATVGIGGLTLGGGIGWIVRKHGLTIDHLLAVELITADGRLVRTSETEHPELFWGLRGGSGNFGIATAFEFTLHPAGTVFGGAVLYSADEGEQVLRACVDYASQAPDELTVMAMVMPAPPAPFVPVERQGELSIAIGIVYTGDLAEGERVVAPLRNLGTPIADIVGPMPYPAIYALTKEAAIKGVYHEVRSMFLRELDDATIASIMAHCRRSPSPFPRAQLRILGGQMARVPRERTAFVHRDKPFMFSVFQTEADRTAWQQLDPWMTAFWNEIHARRDGVYVNFLQDEPARIAEAYDAATLTRLAALKQQYDPTNLFRRNQNIKPGR